MNSIPLPAKLLLSMSLLYPATVPSSLEAGPFATIKKPGDALEIHFIGKPIARYQFGHDPSTPERLHETYKPFLHVLDPDTGKPITKGAGGRFTHHRGIFVGWNRVMHEGQRYDLWHMKGVQQVHQRFLEPTADEDHVGITSVIHWNDASGDPLIVEHRQMVFQLSPVDGTITQIDLNTTLKALKDGVMLNGDPEHAGIQYRPADKVDDKRTRYLFPAENANPRQDVDYPWVAQSHWIGDHQYSVVHMNHPKNPKGTKYSAYRDYGRFGAFFTTPLDPTAPLNLRYRFLVIKGPLPDRSTIHDLWQSYQAARE